MRRLACFAIAIAACGGGKRDARPPGALTVAHVEVAVVPAADAGGAVSLHVSFDYHGGHDQLALRTICVAAGRRWLEDGALLAGPGRRLAGAFTVRALPAAPDWCQIGFHWPDGLASGEAQLAFCARRGHPAERGECHEPFAVAGGGASYVVDPPRVERTASRLRVLVSLTADRPHAALSFVNVKVACGGAHADGELPVQGLAAGDSVMAPPVDLDAARAGDAPCTITVGEEAGGVAGAEALAVACYRDGAVHDGACS